MGLKIPNSISEIFTKLANDFKNEITKSNPFKNKSMIKAFLASFSGRIWDFYKKLEYLIDQCFDATSDDEYLIREASDYGLTRKPATSASGNISVVGTASITIPSDTEFVIDNSVYVSQSDTDIESNTYVVTLDYIDSDIECTFGVEHNIGNGQTITISGASVTGFNGSHVVDVTDGETVEFTVENVGSGSINASATIVNALVAVVSEEFGEDENRNSGEILNMSTSIVGVDNEAVVVYSGIGGGIDLEEIEDLRSRLQQKKKNPASFFNSAQVETKLREISWVDRVFIKRVTPTVGQATIYLVKAENEIPSATEIQQAEDYFEEYLPINTDYTVIHIEAPTALATDFTFSSITPDTVTMRDAIEANLKAYFEDVAEVGEDVTEEVYRGVIINTVDEQSLERLTAFTLVAPAGDISPNDDELPTLGSVSF
jgi:uncharacterized phage protein gp47/JayE